MGRKPGLCFACGKPGHWRNDCLSVKSTASSGKAGSSSVFEANKISKYCILIDRNHENQYSLSTDNLVNIHNSPVGKLRKAMNKWKSVNVGLTFNRLADYGRNFTYSGVSNGSRLTAFAANATGTPTTNLDPYEGWVAYNAYLIDSVAPNTYAANGGVSSILSYPFNQQPCLQLKCDILSHDLN